MSICRFLGWGASPNTQQVKTMFPLRNSNYMIPLKEITQVITLFQKGQLEAKAAGFYWCSQIPKIFMNPQFKDQLFLFVITLMRGVFDSTVPITLKLSNLGDCFIYVGEGENTMKLSMNGETNKAAIEIAISQTCLTVKKQYVAGVDYILSPMFVCRKNASKENAYDIGYIGWHYNPFSRFSKFVGFIVDNSECTLGERTSGGKLDCGLGLMIITVESMALMVTGRFKDGAPDGDNVRLQLDSNTVGAYTFQRGEIISAQITRTLRNGMILKYSGKCRSDSTPCDEDGKVEVFAPNKSLISCYSGNFAGDTVTKTKGVNLYPRFGAIQFFVASKKTQNCYSGEFNPASGEVVDGRGKWSCTKNGNVIFQVEGKFSLSRQKSGSAEVMMVKGSRISCENSKREVVIHGDVVIDDMRSQAELRGKSQKFQLYGINGVCDEFCYTLDGLSFEVNSTNGAPKVLYTRKFLDDDNCCETIKIAIPNMGISLEGRFNDDKASASMTFGSGDNATVLEGTLTINSSKITFVTQDNATYEFSLHDIQEKVNPWVHWKEANSIYKYCAQFKDGKPSGDYEISTMGKEQQVWYGKVRDGVLGKEVKTKIDDIEFKSQIVNGQISMDGMGKGPNKPWCKATLENGKLTFEEAVRTVVAKVQDPLSGRPSQTSDPQSAATQKLKNLKEMPRNKTTNMTTPEPAVIQMGLSNAGAVDVGEISIETPCKAAAFDLDPAVEVTGRVATPPTDVRGSLEGIIEGDESLTAADRVPDDGSKLHTVEAIQTSLIVEVRGPRGEHLPYHKY